MRCPNRVLGGGSHEHNRWAVVLQIGSRSFCTIGLFFGVYFLNTFAITLTHHNPVLQTSLEVSSAWQGGELPGNEGDFGFAILLFQTFTDKLCIGVVRAKFCLVDR